VVLLRLVQLALAYTNEILMKSHIKYGLITTCCWNVLLLFALIIRADIKEVSISYFFDDGMGGIAMTMLFIAWALIWFGIGSHSRKDYLIKQQSYKDMFPNIDNQVLHKAFTSYYFSRHAKMLSIVFASAIPWYVIGYVRESFNITDFAVIAPLMFLSIICFWFYKRYKLT